LWHLNLFDAQILAQNLIEGAKQLHAAGGAVLPAGRRDHERRRALEAHRQRGARGGRPRQGRARLRGDHRGLLLASLSGSAVADAAALTALLLPMMVRAGHDKARSPVCSPPAASSRRSSAVDRLRDLRRRRQRVDHQAVPGRHRAGLLIGASLWVTWWWLSRREQIPVAAAQVVRRNDAGAARIRLGDGCCR